MLQEYKRKRRFGRTPEPPPSPGGEGGQHLTFVVQEHAARRLHWDFRLEWGGVLKSWAVPKGPSLNPDDKHLAVHVEDHPLAYGAFEGVIPKGEYGAGPVIVWDRGIYSPDEGGVTSWQDRAEAEERMRRGYQEGKLSVFLRGRKLKGSWTLVRTKRGEGKDWLLIKHRDQYASSRDVLLQDRSVISGLTVRDLREGLRSPERPSEGAAVPHPQAVKAPFPEDPRPMLAMLARAPFDREGWLFEVKLDGIRALASVRDGEVELRSRKGNNITRAWPSIVASLASQFEREMLIDGEIVALDEKGVPRFQALQPRMHLTRKGDIERAEAEIPALFYAFDLLYLNGYDLRKVPLAERKAILWQALDQDQRLRYVEYIERDGLATFQGARRLGFEGVIAKKGDSLYEPGVRSRNWLKVKAVQRQEFVVCGYTEGSGGRRGTFGALVLGYYEEEGRLVHAGSVGSGFKEGELVELKEQLDRLQAKAPPFEQKPDLGGMRVTWVRPQMVVEVKFSEWTKDGLLRAPVYLGLRPDVDPRQVRREDVALTVAKVDVSGDAGLAGAVAEVLEQLERPKGEFFVNVQGERIKLTNLDKQFWPAHDNRPALSKRDLIRYYTRVAPWLLPHLRDRPLTLTRYADGISGQAFYQKQLPKVSSFVQTVRLWSNEHQHDREYVLCNNLATLVWLAQLADLEMHAWMARINPEPDAPELPTKTWGSEEAIDASVLNYPDFLVIDLDPYIYAGSEAKGEEPALNRRAFEMTREFAFRVRELLEQLRLSAFVKTTGKTGLHVYVPLVRRYDYDQIRAASEAMGRFLRQRYPSQLSLDWSVEKRRGKVFFDHKQNMRGKTLAAPYSLRPTPAATVSMPVTWDELPSVYPTDFTIDSAPSLLEKRGDAWAGILEAKRDLKALLQRGAG